ncbi:hypothetical protein LSH36_301g01064, partial [Paralvinella palmiformis]
MFMVILGSILALIFTYIVYTLLPGSYNDGIDTSLDAFIIKSEG